MLIPLVNRITQILVYIDASKRFGRGIGFAVRLIFRPFVFFPILAFGRAQYTGST